MAYVNSNPIQKNEFRLMQSDYKTEKKKRRIELRALH
jgi:hypothetical protein